MFVLETHVLLILGLPFREPQLFLSLHFILQPALLHFPPLQFFFFLILVPCPTLSIATNFGLLIHRSLHCLNSLLFSTCSQYIGFPPLFISLKLFIVDVESTPLKVSDIVELQGTLRCQTSNIVRISWVESRLYTVEICQVHWLWGLPDIEEGKASLKGERKPKKRLHIRVHSQRDMLYW